MMQHYRLFSCIGFLMFDEDVLNLSCYLLTATSITFCSAFDTALGSMCLDSFCIEGLQVYHVLYFVVVSEGILLIYLVAFVFIDFRGHNSRSSISLAFCWRVLRVLRLPLYESFCDLSPWRVRYLPYKTCLSSKVCLKFPMKSTAWQRL